MNSQNTEVSHSCCGMADGLMDSVASRANEINHSVWDHLVIASTVFSFVQCVGALVLGAVIIGNEAFYVYEPFYVHPAFQVAGILLYIVGAVRVMVLTVESRMPEEGQSCLVVLIKITCLIGLFLAGLLMIFEYNHVRDTVVGAMEEDLDTYARNHKYGIVPELLDETTVNRSRDIWDKLQKQEECCGIHGPVDWVKKYRSLNSTTAQIRGNPDNPRANVTFCGGSLMPASCCLTQTETETDQGTETADGLPVVFHRTGCIENMDYIERMILGSAMFAILFSVVPVLNGEFPTWKGNRKDIGKKD